MQIIIPSYNRAKTITTHLLLKGLNYKIVLHNQQQKQAYLKNKTINPNKIVVSNAKQGVINQRNWIWHNLIKPGEWFVTMDDNIKYFTCVDKPYYNKQNINCKNMGNGFRQQFEKKCNTARALEIFNECINKANKTGACLIGFAPISNYYFRGKKWREVGYVITKLAIIKKTNKINYDLNLEAMEDFGFTAQNLLVYGKVLINNYFHPVAGHYEQGGIGTYTKRLPRKITDSFYLIKKYPGLFRYKKKVGCHEKAELQLRFNSLKQVDEWRRNLIVTGK